MFRRGARSMEAIPPWARLPFVGCRPMVRGNQNDHPFARTPERPMGWCSSCVIIDMVVGARLMDAFSHHTGFIQSPEILHSFYADGAHMMNQFYTLYLEPLGERPYCRHDDDYENE